MIVILGEGLGGRLLYRRKIAESVCVRESEREKERCER